MNVLSVSKSYFNNSKVQSNNNMHTSVNFRGVDSNCMLNAIKLSSLSQKAQVSFSGKLKEKSSEVSNAISAVLNLLNVDANKALLEAAKSKNTEALKALLEVDGIDVNHANMHDWTALDYVQGCKVSLQMTICFT